MGMGGRRVTLRCGTITVVVRECVTLKSVSRVGFYRFSRRSQGHYGEVYSFSEVRNVGLSAIRSLLDYDSIFHRSSLT